MGSLIQTGECMCRVLGFTLITVCTLITRVSCFSFNQYTRILSDRVWTVAIHCIVRCVHI